MASNDSAFRNLILYDSALLYFKGILDPGFSGRLILRDGEMFLSSIFEKLYPRSRLLYSVSRALSTLIFLDD